MRYWVEKETDIAEKQCQGLGKVFSSNKDNQNENESLNKKNADPKTITKGSIISQT